MQKYLCWWGIYSHRYISLLDTTNKEMREKVTTIKMEKKKQEKSYLTCTVLCTELWHDHSMWWYSCQPCVDQYPSHKWEDSDVEQWSDLTRFLNPLSPNPRSWPPSTTSHHIVSFSDITQQSFLSSLSWEIAMIDQDTH